MQRFLQFRLQCHGLHIAAGCFAGAAHVIGLTECAWLAVVVLWGLRSTWFLNVLAMLLCGFGMQACSQPALTP